MRTDRQDPLPIPELLTESAAARWLGISVHCLRSWRYSRPRRGPRVVRLGIAVRYSRRDLERLVEESAEDTADQSSRMTGGRVVGSTSRETAGKGRSA